MNVRKNVVGRVSHVMMVSCGSEKKGGIINKRFQNDLASPRNIGKKA